VIPNASKSYIGLPSPNGYPLGKFHRNQLQCITLIMQNPQKLCGFLDSGYRS